jgi:hypothetical protein
MTLLSPRYPPSTRGNRGRNNRTSGLSACLILLCSLCLLLGSGVLGLSVQAAPATAGRVAIFYHVYAKNITLTSTIIDEQIMYLRRSGLESAMDKLYYGVVADATQSIDLATKYGSNKYQRIGLWKEGQEMKTLAKLYAYCSDPKSANDKVMYFHTKGSMREAIHQTNMRIVLHAYTLHRDCIRALDSHDTCGWRLSPLPFVHYPGRSLMMKSLI